MADSTAKEKKSKSSSQPPPKRAVVDPVYNIGESTYIHLGDISSLNPAGDGFEHRTDVNLKDGRQLPSYQPVATLASRWREYLQAYPLAKKR